MTDDIRCPSCRGAKKVPKLGGMIGECGTCKGKGTILASDKPKPVVVEVTESVADIVKATSEALPFTRTTDVQLGSSDKIVIDSVEVDTKVDGKKALYKRKSG